MRRMLHVSVAAVILLALVIGGLFVWAVEPTLGGNRVLDLNLLVTARSTGLHSRLRPPEAAIQLTDPQERSQLALRYEPTLITSAGDRFWPVSVLDTLRFRWARHGTCLYVADSCRHEPPQPADLVGGSLDDYLSYPSPVNSVEDE